jgi:hypothetical protein
MFVLFFPITTTSGFGGSLVIISTGCPVIIKIIIISYIAHFTTVPMRFATTSGGLFRAAYAQWQQLTIMRDN